MSSKDTDEVPIKRGIDGWYSEVKDFASDVGAFAFTHETGHFTQLIWGDTAEVLKFNPLGIIINRNINNLGTLDWPLYSLIH